MNAKELQSSSMRSGCQGDRPAIHEILRSLLVVATLPYYDRREARAGNPSFWSSLVAVNRVMLLLVIGNVAQVESEQKGEAK